MAEKTLNTRIMLKVDTLANWNTSSLVLKNGELAFATVAAGVGTGLQEPVVMCKIGDGTKTFDQLPWAFHAKASDVLSACKSESALNAFVDGRITNASLATSSELSALSSKVTTAESNISTLQTDVGAATTGLKARMTAVEDLVGDTGVADQISAAITNLNLGTTYAPKTHSHAIADVTGLQDALNGKSDSGHTHDYIPTTEKGLANGVAKLDKNGIIVASQLPSYVDDVVDGYLHNNMFYEDAAHAKKLKDESSKIYIDLSTNKTYRWSGSQYVVISDTLALGTTSSTAFAGDKGETAYNHVSNKSNPHGVTAAQVGADPAGSAASALRSANSYTNTQLAEKVGESTVSEQIAAATGSINTSISSLEDASHTHANKAELDLFVTGDKAKLDTAVQTITANTGLTATKSGTGVTIGFNDAITFVFDCGDSTGN